MNATATKIYSIADHPSRKEIKPATKKRMKFSELTLKDQIDSIKSKRND